MHETVEFIHYYPKADTSWTFTIRGNAAKASEEYEEILAIVKRMMEITRGFYEPLELRYGFEVYPEDVSIYSLIKDSKNAVSGTKRFEEFRVVRSQDGISYEDLLHDIQDAHVRPGVKVIRGLGFNSGKTKFSLRDREEYIDKHSKGLYEVTDGGYILDVPNKDDPLSFSIGLSAFNNDGNWVSSTDHAYYYIDFKTYTDIWFYETELGILNCNRLKKIYKEIADSFTVVDLLYLSDLYLCEWLTEITPNVSL